MLILLILFDFQKFINIKKSEYFLKMSKMGSSLRLTLVAGRTLVYKLAGH